MNYPGQQYAPPARQRPVRGFKPLALLPLLLPALTTGLRSASAADLEPVIIDTPSLLVFAAVGLAVIGTFGWAWLNTRDQRRQLDAESQLFTNRTLSELQATAAMPADAPAATDEPIYLEVPESPGVFAKEIATPMRTTQTSRAAKAQNRLKRAMTLLHRLKQTGQVKTAGGTVNIGEGEHLILLELSDGKHAIIFDSIPRPEVLARQLKRCDVAFIALEGQSAVVVEGFGEYIARRVTL